MSSGGFWATAVAASGLVVLAASLAAGAALYGSGLWVGWLPVLVAVAVALVVPAIGLLPLLRVDRSEPVRTAQAAQMATAVRLGAAAVAALVVLLLLPSRSTKIAFGLWMVGLYLVSLVVEMSVLATWLKAGGRPK